MSSLPPIHPEEFEEYRTEEYLGRGSYGDVFRVVRDDKQYALKWLRNDVEADAAKRFENEIWALQQLHHPVVPEFVARGMNLDRPYAVMTLARGRSLRKVALEQAQESTLIGQVRILTITVAVLDALAHILGRGICHRDVKDDNIVATESASQVSLIDFGFCRGAGQPQEVQTVWNAGAARYSPPSKLEHPAYVHLTHDVFAVGVVAYLLLTNSYPWDLHGNDDVGDLRKRMLRDKPEAIATLNPQVSREVAEFFGSLLRIDDDHRPTAELALQTARNIFEGLANKRAAPAVSPTRRIIFPRVLRDPVHGDIRLTEFEWEVLDTREFQRLRWIRQLGFAHFVYPGAEHTRFAHAIGTMHVADKIMRSIEDITGSPFDPEERLLVRCYALVHDVTHIPYGHTIEDELGFFSRHDQHEPRNARLLLSDKSEIGTLLRTTEYGRAALAYIDRHSGVATTSYVREAIEGPVGADVLDYIDRDSYYCGLDHRVDSAIFRRYRLASVPRSDRDDDHLVARVYGSHGLRLDAEFALESVLLERFGLYLKVYTHSAKVAAGAMLGKALSAALFGRRKPALDERAIEWMGDSELLLALRSSGATAKVLAEMLLRRQLYQSAFRARALRNDERDPRQYDIRIDQFREKGLLNPEARSGVERMLAKRVGLKPADVIIYCVPAAPGYQKVRQYVEEQPGLASLRDEVHAPHLRIVDRHLALWSVYVLASPTATTPQLAQLAGASEDFLGLKNELQTDRRQGVLF